MKAIVLTFDKYHSLTDHMIRAYQEVWPEHPFTFRVPYQSYPKERKEYFGDRIELIESPKQIKQTGLRLLEDIQDDEWIYWCIDDKYPISMNTEVVSSVCSWVQRIESTDISGFLLCRRSKHSKRKHVSRALFPLRGPGETMFLRRKSYAHIWIHQFCRAKVIRKMFSQLPEVIKNAKEVDKLKFEMKIPSAHRLYVSKRSYMVFGESTTRGKLTRNVVESLRGRGMKVPEGFEIEDKEIIVGSL